MKRQLVTCLGALLVLVVVLTGCGQVPQPIPQPTPIPPSGGAPQPADPGNGPTAGNLEIRPLSPGAMDDTVIDTGSVQVRALLEIDTSVQIAGIGVWLDGRTLQREVLEWDFGGEGRRRYVIRAVPDPLDNGQHSVRLAVKVGAATQEKSWSFTVKREVATAPPQESTVLNLYFADSPLVVAGFTTEAGFVTRVQRVVPKTQRPALRAIEELIAGPAAGDGEVDRTLPAGAKVLGVTIKDRVAYVNLDENFGSLHPGGTTGGAITMQSLIMTLTEFPTVDRVQVLVAGQPWCDGHFIWEEPLPRPKFEMKSVEVPAIR